MGKRSDRNSNLQTYGDLLKVASRDLRRLLDGERLRVPSVAALVATVLCGWLGSQWMAFATILLIAWPAMWLSR